MLEDVTGEMLRRAGLRRDVIEITGSNEGYGLKYNRIDQSILDHKYTGPDQLRENHHGYSA